MRLDPTIVRQQIADLLAVCPDLAEDETLAHDMIEGETEAFDFLRLIARRIIETGAIEAGTGEYIAQLAERRARLKRRIEALRGLALKVVLMLPPDKAGKRKAELPECTLGVSKGRQSLAIADEGAVPDEMCEVKLIPDRDAIREVLDAGVELNWAELVTGPETLTMRVK